MAIELLNCKGMLSQDYIDDIKTHIADYHQGFMVVNNELYLPRYKVLSLELDYDEDTEVIVLDDYNKATAKDNLAQLFNGNEYASNEELIDSIHPLVLDLCHTNYWQGYHDGFNRGA